MFRTYAITGLAALTLSTATFAATEPTVKSVEVEVELEAIANPKAANYWTTIADDLENAIVARITDHVDEEGMELKVDIEEVSLSGGLDEKFGFADTRLVGTVTMLYDPSNGRSDVYELSVDINAAKIYVPADVDVTTIPADSRVYYDAMIDTFADGVAERLK